MIVYGDSDREESVEAMMTSIRTGIARVDASAASRGGVDCEALRRLLIQAGELEQAAYDTPTPLGAPAEVRRALRAFRSATSAAASAFHSACISPRGGAGAQSRVRSALARMLRALGRLSGGEGGTCRVWVKPPRGFAFHGLFPERYREAALGWTMEHPDAVEQDVLVVGIRSIGTTLSAVVTAVLEARGVRARRVTVRVQESPSEHPLLLKLARPADWALIVHDGPGPSGAFRAVADALTKAGAGRIHVFPDHDGAPLEGARFDGSTLPDALWSAACSASEDPLSRVVSCGRGEWRSIHFDARDRWPAVCRNLERPKLLCEGSSGRRILFKFAGLTTAPGATLSLAEVHAQKLARLARRGFTPAPLATAHGFVATEWIEGRPMVAAEASPDFLGRVGRYVAAASGPPLSASAARSARNRLETMLSVNTREALGDDWADQALSLFRPIAILENTPRAGDGHMAPHEWIAAGDGSIQKTDAGGHELDPTWTGRQPVLWDLAGAMLEWDLDPEGERAFLDGFAVGGGHSRAPLALDAYRAAYAAHRVGQVGFARDTEEDPDERERLGAEYERWRDKLALCLGGHKGPSSSRAAIVSRAR